MDTRLEYNLKQLRLATFIQSYQEQAEEAIKNQLSYIQYLAILTELEVIKRSNALIQRRLKEAQFPIIKTLDSFDFTQVASVKKETILQLCEGNFATNAKNIIFFGPCGTGKTHLALALGRELCLKKYRVYFKNVSHFINLLQEANQNLSLHKFFKRMGKYDLIILDELGYIPFEREATNLLFQFLAEQYERRSLLITTNLAFSQWDQIFKDKLTTVATVDRLIHHSYVLQFHGESYRLKSSQKENKDRKKEG
jgi:DNA replication protein DnaC